MAPHLSIDTDLARALARTCRRTGDDADRLRALVGRTAIAADVRVVGLALLDRIDETLQLSADTVELRADLAEAYHLDQPGAILRLDDRLGQAQNDLDRVLATPVDGSGLDLPGLLGPTGGGIPFPLVGGALDDGPLVDGPFGERPGAQPPWLERPQPEPSWPRPGGSVCPPVVAPPFGGFGEPGFAEPGLGLPGLGVLGPAVSVTSPVVSHPGTTINHSEHDAAPAPGPVPDDEPVGDGGDAVPPTTVDDEDPPDPHGIEFLTGHPPDEIAQGIAGHAEDERFPDLDREQLAEEVEEVLRDPLAPQRPTDNGIVVRDEERGRTIIINREVPFRSTVIEEKDARWRQR